MGLFERFQPPNSGVGQTGANQAELLSVLRNLENVLNTKRGWGSFLPDFGMSALTEHASRDIVADAVIRELQECVARFEPRLRIDKLSRDDRETNPFWLSFTMQCSVITATQTVKVSINTVFGGVTISNP
jgi:type VI secretion system protein